MGPRQVNDNAPSYSYRRPANCDIDVRSELQAMPDVCPMRETDGERGMHFSPVLLTFMVNRVLVYHLLQLYFWSQKQVSSRGLVFLSHLKTSSHREQTNYFPRAHNATKNYLGRLISQLQNKLVEYTYSARNADNAWLVSMSITTNTTSTAERTSEFLRPGACGALHRDFLRFRHELRLTGCLHAFDVGGEFFPALVRHLVAEASAFAPAASSFPCAAAPDAVALPVLPLRRLQIDVQKLLKHGAHFGQGVLGFVVGFVCAGWGLRAGC